MKYSYQFLLNNKHLATWYLPHAIAAIHRAMWLSGTILISFIGLGLVITYLAITGKDWDFRSIMSGISIIIWVIIGVALIPIIWYLTTRGSDPSYYAWMALLPKNN